ncbi:SUKH-4 family immunity protein [Streptomyces venezuelae]|uniref:SUKH-4 family immunity protein n=1 Tax=Streptomyces venezuelae TaxID=54571 RepID=UPI003453CBB3
MLFDVTRSAVTGIFGEDRLVTLPASAFPGSAADTQGARLLQSVGAPTGTLHLREPDEGSGALPLVRDVVDVEDIEGLEDIGEEAAGVWPVFGWLLNAHLALDPASGKVYAFDLDEETARELHADVSSLVHVAVGFQRLLDEFTFGDDGEEAGFERLEREVARIREETSRVDPLPFRDDETAWWVIGDEIAAGQRFTGDSPGGRSLYG